MEEINNFSLSQYSKNKHIYANHDSMRSNYKSCRNDCFMVAYIAHGSGFLEWSGKSFAVTEGDVFLIPPGLVYRFTPIPGLLKLDIYFCYFVSHITGKLWQNLREEFTGTQDFFEGKNIVSAADSANKEIRDILVRMIDEQFYSDKCSYNVMFAYLIILLTKVFRNIKTRDFKRVYSQNVTVDEAIRTIYKDLYTDVSLGSLAAYMNKSPSFICRMFKQHTGMTTSQFINMLRVEKIKDALKNTNKPIQGICEMFSVHPEYMKRIFKNETGMSMSEYRKKYHYTLSSNRDI